MKQRILTHSSLIHSSAWKKGRLQKRKKKGLEVIKNPGIPPEFFLISQFLGCHLPISLKIPRISSFPTPHLGAGVLESLTLSKMTESDPKKMGKKKNSWNFVPPGFPAQILPFPIPNKILKLLMECKSFSQGFRLFGHLDFHFIWDLWGF